MAASKRWRAAVRQAIPEIKPAVERFTVLAMLAGQVRGLALSGAIGRKWRRAAEKGRVS